MPKEIDEFLEQLKAHLKKSDPATIQDALTDAEEHLHGALEDALAMDPNLTESQALIPVLDQFGAPEEVAAEYMKYDKRFSLGLIPNRSRKQKIPFLSVMIDTRAYGALIYLLSAFFPGLVYITWVLVGTGLSLGMSPFIFGLPFFSLFIHSLQIFALMEGRIAEALLGVRMPRRQSVSWRTGGWWRDFKIKVQSLHTWSIMAFMVVHFLLSCIYFYVFIGLVATSIELMAQPIFYLFQWPYMRLNEVSYYAPGWSIVPAVALGFLLLVLTMHFARFLGAKHSALAKAMLVRS